MPHPHPPTHPPTPTTRDGHNIDPSLGDEHGEAAAITVRAPDIAWPIAPDAVPTVDHAPADTYYDLPVIKAAPWKWYIPAYFHLSGVAGAAASLAGALEIVAPDRALGGKLRWTAALGDAAGAALLIADLGRPSRFHHMLRVFRPTSPMNAGTWILSSAGATSVLGLWWAFRGRRPPLPVSIVGLATGSLLSTYTGVLIGNTAVPIWSTTRRHLPIWFAASSAASLASLLELIAPEHRAVRTYSAVAKAAEVATMHAVARAARSEGVDAPLRRGRSGALWRGATWLGIASLAATLWPGGRRPWLAGALGTAAALLGRYAIVHAGHASAADPRATFAPQRRQA